MLAYKSNKIDPSNNLKVEVTNKIEETFQASNTSDEYDEDSIYHFLQSKRGRKPKPFSDWITVEKRRPSQNVIAHYVRIKDEQGNKKVGLTDYMSVEDFEKRFDPELAESFEKAERRKEAYENYRQSLIEIYKAQAIRAGKGIVSDSGSSV